MREYNLNPTVLSEEGSVVWQSSASSWGHLINSLITGLTFHISTSRRGGEEKQEVVVVGMIELCNKEHSRKLAGGRTGQLHLI